MTLLAFIPVCTTFTALGLLAFVVVLIGAHNRTEADEQAPSQPWQFTWQWVVAIAITLLVPVLMFLLIWFLPEGDQ